MGVFRRKAREAIFGPDPLRTRGVPPEPGEAAQQEPELQQRTGLQPPAPEPGEIQVARTLVKSEPELAELVAAEPRLSGDGIYVSPVERGFGTRVEIRARPGSGLAENDLESLLDRFSEPQKRPFSAS